MPVVNLYDAKNQLSKLVAEAVAGADIVIAKNGRPQVRLQPIEANAPRELGVFQGLFSVPDDFDEPLPAEILGQFHG